MDHEGLETALGIKFDDVAEGEILPPEKWQILNKVDSHGGTPLMKAVRSCDVNTVEGLLRCGVDVNARDKAGRRAIDYALDGSSEAVAQVALLLLKRDSLLPAIAKDVKRRSKFDGLVQNNEGIAKVFDEREAFHAMVKGNDVDSIQKLFKECDMKSSGVKYWVNREGQSALYAAILGKSFEAWALLRSKQFVYGGEEEEKEWETKFLKNEADFKKAMENYFAPMTDYHVLKMVLCSKVRGSALGMSQKIHRIFEEIDEEPKSSLLLKCLQKEPRFEVVFDFERTDIQCICVALNAGGLPGVFHPMADRVYVGANVTETFSHRDVVSNLVHELAHKALHLVFGNNGLPFKKDDEEKRKEYEDLVSKVMVRIRRDDPCDEILKRVSRYEKELHPYELIVRVPEIAIKYHPKTAEDEKDKGMKILESQAKDLLEYYEKVVIPEMENYIEKSKATKMIPKADFINSLISDEKNDCFEVSCTGKPDICPYMDLYVLRVSNLKLGVSHLEKWKKNILCLDSRLYVKYQEVLGSELERGQQEHVALVWGEEMGSQFQEFCAKNVNEGTYLRNNKSITSLIPKNFNVDNVKLVAYKWNDLSDKTKKWVLDKKVTFQGREVTFQKMIEGVLCKTE